MAHWFHIEFYNSVSHMATVETDCAGLRRVTVRETVPLLFFSSTFNSVLSPAVFKNQSINPEEDFTYVFHMHFYGLSVIVFHMHLMRANSRHNVHAGLVCH